MRGRALGQAVAAWLDFASGAMRWDELLREGDIFHERMARVEAVLMNPDATRSELAEAARLARTATPADTSRCKGAQ